MMTRYKSKLLTATATAALLGFTASGALAFDDVDWEWNKLVDEYVDIDIVIDDRIDVSGITQIEKIQLFFGDVTATATVDSIYNNAQGEGGENGGTILVPVEGSGNFNLTYVDPADNTSPDGPAGTVRTAIINDPSGLSLTLGGGLANENTNTLGPIQYEISGELEVEVGAVDFGDRDAADLPLIDNIATAVGNNQSITSSTAMMLHDGQFIAGGFDGDRGFPSIPIGGGDVVLASIDGPVQNELEDDSDFITGNTHTDIALLLTLGAAFGLINPATIDAQAHVGDDDCENGCEESVTDILNARVNNAATAVANNASYTINPATAGDATMIADLTQFAYANVNSDATVNDVVLNAYGGFGDANLGGVGDDVQAIISNAATSVGNNLNININKFGEIAE